MNRVDRAVYRRLLALRKTNPDYELVFQEPPSKAAPEWKPVVRGTMTRLSDGSLAYLFSTAPLKKQEDRRRWNKRFKTAATAVFQHPPTRAEIKRLRRAWAFLNICSRCDHCHSVYAQYSSSHSHRTAAHPRRSRR